MKCLSARVVRCQTLPGILLSEYCVRPFFPNIFFKALVFCLFFPKFKTGGHSGIIFFNVTFEVELKAGNAGKRTWEILSHAQPFSPYNRLEKEEMETSMLSRFCGDKSDLEWTKEATSATTFLVPNTLWPISVSSAAWLHVSGHLNLGLRDSFCTRDSTARVFAEKTFVCFRPKMLLSYFSIKEVLPFGSIFHFNFLQREAAESYEAYVRQWNTGGKENSYFLIQFENFSFVNVDFNFPIDEKTIAKSVKGINLFGLTAEIALIRTEKITKNFVHLVFWRLSNMLLSVKMLH